MASPEADYRSLVEQIPAVPYMDLLDEDQTPVYIGPQIETILGIARDEYMAGPNWWERRHIHPEDRERVVAERAKAIAEGGSFDFDYRGVRPDGRVAWIRDQGTVVRDSGGAISMVEGILLDVTAIKRGEEVLRRQTRYQAVLHQTALAAMRRPDERDLLREIVRRAASIAGTPHGYAYVLGDRGVLEVKAGTGMFVDWVGFTLKTGEGLAGRVVLERQPLVIDDYDAWEGRSAGFPPGILGPLIGVPLTSGDRGIGAIGLSNPPGGPTFSEQDVTLLSKFAEIASLSLENARLYASAQEELSQRERAEERLQFLAFHDALTGLPNRAMFEELLDLALARARRHDLAVAVVYMDLDNFKLVNDSLGHTAGDDLLRETAARLKAAVRETDVVGRQGGDEFLVLLADLERDDNPASTEVPDERRAIEAAERVAARIKQALATPFASTGTEIYTSPSMGVSLFPFDADDGPTLLRYADAAMYASKRVGPGRHTFFVSEMADSANMLSFTTRLRKAVDQSEWVMHYQPIVDLSEGALIGVEALLRWQQADGSLIMPGHFIPLVEEMGLISALGDWVLGEVCRQARLWQDAGASLFTSFNLSLGQLWQPDLDAKVLARIRESGVDPTRVVIEITESSAMTDLHRSQRILAQLREAGLRLAIDDFGTGQSSLSRLRNLPADILKIDRPFLVGLPDEPVARSMVKAIVEVAHGLGMTPLAEGVEREEQRLFLVQNGCRMGQGFYYSPAVPAAEIDRMVGQPRVRARPGVPW